MKISLRKIYSGKVRDIYQIDGDRILIVASDRLSAFDVILDDPILGKGEILTQMSNEWFKIFKNLIANHLTGDSVYDVLPKNEAEMIIKRAVVAKKLNPVKIEAVVRGYLTGGGWKEYQKTGEICGIKLPKNLQLSQELPEIIFTPSSKADIGNHDENISFQEVCDLIGAQLANEIKTQSIQLYKKASQYAKSRGIIIADTKFEFGLDQNGILTLMDEVLTPDSSRFWELKTYQIGKDLPSLDKQFIRNWLESIHWNKVPPVPKVPTEVIKYTQELYQYIYKLLFQ